MLLVDLASGGATWGQQSEPLFGAASLVVRCGAALRCGLACGDLLSRKVFISRLRRKIDVGGCRPNTEGTQPGVWIEAGWGEEGEREGAWVGGREGAWVGGDAHVTDGKIRAATSIVLQVGWKPKVARYSRGVESAKFRAVAWRLATDAVTTE